MLENIQNYYYNFNYKVRNLSGIISIINYFIGFYLIHYILLIL